MRGRSLHRHTVITSLLLLITLATAPAAWGQAASNPESEGIPRGQELTVRAVRVATPPSIDGVLDEAIWQQIEPITGFRQRWPVDGAPASERTEVRIAYDS